MSVKDERLLVTIKRAVLDSFWSRKSGTVKGNLTMVNSLGKVASGEIEMETWLPHMGPFLISNEAGMSFACTTLIFSLRKRRHVEHLQGYLMRK